MLGAAIAILFALPPRPAAHVAAVVTGAPLRTLLHVCERESGCRALGVHRVDAGAGAVHWRIAVRGGALHPSRCRAHALGERAREWSTRGPFGSVAAYSVRYLPAPLDCIAPPSVLDVPIVSALAAGWRMVEADHPAVRRWMSA